MAYKSKRNFAISWNLANIIAVNTQSEVFNI